jgi:hypothetical protein
VAGRRRALALATAAVLGAALLAGCGGSRSTATTAVVYHSPRPLPPSSLRLPARPPARPRVNPQAPRVGATQRVVTSATTLSVTVTSLTDPLEDSHASLVPGTRAVGVIAEVVNDGPGGYDSSSTGDFSVLPSSGAATPLFAPAGACQTRLRDWDNEIGPGQTRSGCVVFAVPSDARILAVRFSPHASPVGRATWRVQYG